MRKKQRHKKMCKYYYSMAKTLVKESKVIIFIENDVFNILKSDIFNLLMKTYHFLIPYPIFLGHWLTRSLSNFGLRERINEQRS